jgi:cytidylate kinase
MDNDKHIIINVGRQLGAGGQEIGRMLAKEFGAAYYDRELLNLAAKESGFSESFFKRNDERKGFLRSFLHLPYGNGIGSQNFYQNNFSQESLFKFQSDAIYKAAQEGSCVFLGRCADYVLRSFPNVVNIFITASLDFRIRIVAEKKGITGEEARKIIEQKEKLRAEYYKYYTGRQWGAAANYDLCIDASILGLEETEAIVATFIRKKFGL